MNEIEYLRIISGQTNSWRARAIKPCLWLLSLLYRVGLGIRNRMFDWGFRSTEKVDIPVISLGNLTTGGTGKTPMVAFLTQWFQRQEMKVALLSRGYRALPGEVNDEKLLLDRLCPGIPHYQNPNRRLSAGKAVAEGAALLILDDGFQHRVLGRNLDIVLIDSICPWGYGHLLPRGLLREPRSSLRRSDFVILTRTDQCSQIELDRLTNEVANYVPQDCIAHAVFKPQGLVNVKGETESLESFAGKMIGAFCAIGNPEGFRRTLENAGFQISHMQTFPDHHHYTSNELNEIGSRAFQTSAELIITTGKDLVKISEQKLSEIPVWAIEIGVEITRGQQAFEARLQTITREVSLG